MIFRAAVRVAQRACTAGTPVAAAAACTVGRSYAASAVRAFDVSSTTSSAAASCIAAVAATAYLTPTAWATAREQSFIMVKPDGVHRGLVADIMKRFEGRGYKLVGIKVLVPTKELAGEHYAEHEGKPFYPKLVDFLSSGAVVAMVWEGNGVVATGRAMIGKTSPQASDPGTIRGDYAIDVGRNIIHGSDSVDSAQKEIALWFKPSELAQYTLATEKWNYE